ncbi:MAG: AraC family transcriptional regulator [Anaerolineae bacterium]
MSIPPQDALNRVIHMLRLEARQFHRLGLAAPWGIQFNAAHQSSFHIIESGSAWLLSPAHSEPLRLGTGDLIVITNQPGYQLVDDPDSSSRPLAEVVDMLRLHHTHQTPTTTVLCNSFEAAYGGLYPLFALLPPWIHVRGENGRAQDWLSTVIYFIFEEMRMAKPGYETIVGYMMQVIFIMVLRYWIENHPPEESGWLGALYHPYIGQVLALMHHQPEQRWTVDALAAEVSMSRSNLATQFTMLVGESPMRYLTRLRMHLAVQMLSDDNGLPLESIAQRVGYSSAFAFSKAFKRLIGVSPKVFRLQHGAAALMQPSPAAYDHS